MFTCRKAASQRREGLARAIPPGSESRTRSRRVLQEPGRPLRLHGKSRREIPGDQLQAPGWRTRQPGERNAGATEVPPSEGNEVRRDGRRGVGAPRNTWEAGEPTRGTPWRKGGAGP